MKTVILSSFLAIFIISGCKKEVDPTLYVNVINTNGDPQEGWTVLTHPCYDLSCDLNGLNQSLVQEKISNVSGEAVFEFNTTAVLDVVASKIVFDVDGEALDTLEFQNTVSIKTKELKKGAKNEFETTVVTD